MKNTLSVKQIEREKIALFNAGKTKSPYYVWLIEQERALKRRERPRTVKKRRRI